MQEAKPSSFDAATVAGRTPDSIDLQLPVLIEDLYDIAKAKRENHSLPSDPPLQGWSRISNEELKQNNINLDLLSNEKSGFDAGFYRGPEGQIVLAFCGTDQLRDWPQNLGQGVGLRTKQYQNAIDLADQAQTAFGAQLILTGHSLGGGLASAAAIINNTPAVTYNSAGVHNNTFERAGLDPAEAKKYAAEGLVRSYNVKNELLTHLQEDSLATRWLMPDAIGHRIELPDPDPLSFGKRLIPGAMLMHRLDLHGIEAVMDSMTLQKLRDAEQGKHVDGPQTGVGSRLLEDAVIRLEPQREQLGLHDNARFLGAAAGLAARSGEQGMQRIDHVMINGERVFSVQGELHDPGHRRSHVNLGREGETDLQANFAQLQRQEQSPQLEQEAPQRRMALG